MNIDEGLAAKIYAIDAAMREQGEPARSVALVFTPGADGKPMTMASATLVPVPDATPARARFVDAEFITFGHADADAALAALVAAITGATTMRADKTAATASSAAARKAAVEAEVAKAGIEVIK